MDKLETHDDFFRITSFVNYNANDKSVPICHEKKSWINFHWNTKLMILDGRFSCKMKTFKAGKWWNFDTVTQFIFLKSINTNKKI